jgi:hypothetical protein
MMNMHTAIRRAVAAAGLLAAIILIGGCGSGGIRGAGATLPADEDSSAFADRLSSQEVVTQNDAMRGVVMLLDGEDRYTTFQQRAHGLRDRGVVDASWDLDADAPVTRGQYAYMIHQAAGLPDCVMTALLGPSQRYCLRELQYRGVMVSGAPYAVINGLEYVSVLRRADEYKRTGKVPDRAGHIEDL